MTAAKCPPNRLPKVVIIGRPNVGKSTLFNRLIGRRQALVHDLPGVTRDRIEQEGEWWVGGRKYRLLLTDTGGLGGERFAEEIEKQVELALEGADCVLALFDARAGLTPADQELIREFKRKGVHRKAPILCAVNKVDAESHENLVSEFFALGLEIVLPVSAEHGRGIDDLQEAVIEALGPDVAERASTEQPEEAEAEPVRVPRVAIMGRPNVGKSTLTNALLREERMITSPIAGTTVDAVDSLAELGGKPFVIVDTAGIRRKSKTEQGVEVLSVVQAKKALERADVAILLLDGETGITDQDEKIGGLIQEAGCGVILALNKWDTQRKNPKFTQELAAERVRKTMGYLGYAPILFVSAKERTGFRDLGELIMEILHQRQIKIPTHEFTEWVRQESTVHNPKNAKFFLCHQAGKYPPTFICHVNDPERVHFSLKRHLINALRERWGYMGSPVRMLFVRGKSREKNPFVKR
ncbi:MAG: ribosome biogenesis GTPase Der [Oligoflexia bacterium]|nr:ribosome biogenesis GTPase Der [Oligoflexia bacterium]